MKLVVRTQTCHDDLDAIEAYIAQDNPKAGADMWLYIDDQVDNLADPAIYRKKGRVDGTLELVLHPNYIVILEEVATTVIVLNVVHAREKYPC